jgi:hypothetical protein
MATNPNIALSYRPNVALERRDPLADAANVQSLQANQFKFDELKRDRDEMMQLQEQLKGMGQDPDLDKLMDVYARSGRPDYVKMGLEGKQKLKEQREYAGLERECVWLGMEDGVELWNRARFEAISRSISAADLATARAFLGEHGL